MRYKQNVIVIVIVMGKNISNSNSNSNSNILHLKVIDPRPDTSQLIECSNVGPVVLLPSIIIHILYASTF